MDLSDPVLEGCTLDVIFDVAILESSFERNELPFLEGLGELREIPPGIDAVPLGAGLVFALVVLPALLGSDVEDDELTVVLSGFGFCILTESADEDDFVEHGVRLRFFWVCPLSAVHAYVMVRRSLHSEVEFRRRPVMAIRTVGIDIAKSVFHLVALDEKGSVVVKKKFSRPQLLMYTGIPQEREIYVR